VITISPDLPEGVMKFRGPPTALPHRYGTDLYGHMFIE
jgi:hypothetical protein